MTEIPDHLRKRAAEARAKAAMAQAMSAQGQIPKKSLLGSMQMKVTPPSPPVRPYDGRDVAWDEAMEHARKALCEAETVIGNDSRESYANLAQAWICYADSLRKQELQNMLEFIQIRDDILEELSD
jgi:hypothetical protein